MATFILYPSITIRLWRAPRKLFCEGLNGRLPLEHSSDSRQTLAKRVSDDLQFFIFRRWKFLWNLFSKISIFFKEVAFWKTYEFLSVTGRSVVKSYCPKWVYFWGDFLGGGENDSICVETLDLAPKLTSTKFWDVDKSNVGNRLKRVLPKFRADRSHPSRVNGRSKFWTQNVATRLPSRFNAERRA